MNPPAESTATLKKFPGPNSWPITNALEINRGFLEFIGSRTEEYGRTFQVNLGQMQMVVFSDPRFAKYVLQDNNRNYIKSFGYEILKLFLGQGLLTSEGDFWLRQRRLAQPAFHRERLRKLSETMAEEANAMADAWKSRGDGPLDLYGEMTAVTMKIVARALLGTDVSAFIGQVSEAIGHLNEFAVKRIQQPVKWPMWLPFPRHLAFRRYKEEMDAIIMKVIEERRLSGVDRDDLLGMLLSARDEDSGEGMDNQQLRDEVMTIFVAGHETTAVAMTWALQEIALHPEVQAKLHEEIDAVTGGRPPQPKDIPNLVYTRQVIDEALRKYPPAWIVGRKALQPDQFDGYLIPHDANILVSTYEIHHSKEIWGDPENFRPERFAPEKAKEIGKYDYFPFGAGPRFCIGNNFALMEMTLLLAAIFKSVKMVNPSGKRAEMEPLITLRPKNLPPYSIQVRG